MENFRNNEAILDIHDKPSPLAWFGLSLQHLFAMFGATVLVPILVGIDPGIALMSSGLGTLAHLTVTKYKLPAYMGSSFAYIGAMQSLMNTLGEKEGLHAIQQGAVTGGLVYLIVALVVKSVGSAWIDKVLPPIVVGPIVMVIGLSLAGTAVSDSMYQMVDGKQVYSLTFLTIAMITVLSVIFFNMFTKGFISLIPILLGIIIGYVSAVVLGSVTGVEIVPFQTMVVDAPLFQAPNIEIPFVNYDFKLYPAAILTMAPIAFVTMTEHFGHVMVLNELTKRDFFKDPGLDRTLTGDGLAQVIAGFVGGPPVTSYGENIGVMAITRVHSVFVIAGAAGFAVVLSFVGKVSGLIRSIPTPVIGGVSFVLFGVIAAAGLKIIVQNKIDFDKKRNLLIASVILVVGIGNLILQFGPTENPFQVTGVAFATVLGIILNAILPEKARNE
ncbi:uracil permease [Pilibacter termitis]|uniref:Uracil permease n=1 Tax=Pilibacter termitis TaxID=263852 RepID=A0A1T4KF39_9ENTE|nr:solute carrier family 23 protein [Pilibacter termitis]SJZ40977.1 uracil permease [Pilibacter termitis]